MALESHQFQIISTSPTLSGILTNETKIILTVAAPAEHASLDDEPLQDEAIACLSWSNPQPVSGSALHFPFAFDKGGYDLSSWTECTAEIITNERDLSTHEDDACCMTAYDMFRIGIIDGGLASLETWFMSLSFRHN